jgi:inorganic triphosphatase YgiF
MNHAFVRFVSRLLIASLACLSFQARAELIGTNQAASAGQAQPARANLVSKLQAYGIAPDHAQARVAALTDAEAMSLADRVADAPAGAIGGEVFGIIFVALFLIWRFTLSDQAKAEYEKSQQGKK